MNDDQRHSLPEQRRLVQRILADSIPAGREIEVCRQVLANERDEEAAFQALFTLLRGALADPFFSIEDSQRVVPILKALARGELKAGDLL